MDISQGTSGSTEQGWNGKGALATVPQSEVTVRRAYHYQTDIGLMTHCHMNCNDNSFVFEIKRRCPVP